MYELIEGLGWVRILSKNPYMVSFNKENKRMNVYFTTGTITIQDTEGKIDTHRNVSTLEEIENICSNL